VLGWASPPRHIVFDVFDVPGWGNPPRHVVFDVFDMPGWGNPPRHVVFNVFNVPGWGNPPRHVIFVYLTCRDGFSHFNTLFSMFLTSWGGKPSLPCRFRLFRRAREGKTPSTSIFSTFRGVFVNIYIYLIIFRGLPQRV
jgi:hypothetical protein